MRDDARPPTIEDDAPHAAPRSSATGRQQWQKARAARQRRGLRPMQTMLFVPCSLSTLQLSHGHGGWAGMKQPNPAADEEDGKDGVDLQWEVSLGCFVVRSADLSSLRNVAGRQVGTPGIRGAKSCGRPMSCLTFNATSSASWRARATNTWTSLIGMLKCTSVPVFLPKFYQPRTWTTYLRIEVKGYVARDDSRLCTLLRFASPILNSRSSGTGC